MSSSENKWSNLIKRSNLIEDENPARYRLQTTTTDHQNEFESYRKITFGERDTKKTHKTILIVGETGTGKTTLINTMINYICGVKREDKIWFEITDDKSDITSVQSQTSIITIYGVYIQENSLDLTIIDTPGYGDTQDNSSHQNIAMNLLSLCTSKDELNDIDAMCLVIKAPQTRLTDSQRNIFDAIQSLFGEDIKENIVSLFTHSTGARPKNALTAVKDAKVKCAVDEKNELIFFLFDNRQSETFECDQVQEQLWNLNFSGTQKFFENIKPKTLKMTKHVLQKRKQLETNISNINASVQKIEEKLNELKKTQDDLEKHKKENKNFEFTAEVPYREKVDIDRAVAKQALCCTVCEGNCHYPGCGWFCDLRGCSVIKNNNCTVCTNKCHISKHVKEAKIYVTKTRIDEGLKKKYNDKIKEKLSVVNKLKEELQELEQQKINLVTDAFICVEFLEMTALNTDSRLIFKHIDVLIEKMKEIKEPEKTEALENIKKRAEERKH